MGLYTPSLHHLDGEAGELVGRDILDGLGGLMCNQLEVVATDDCDHRAVDALRAGVALVAFPAHTEGRAAVLVNPDVPIAAAAEGRVDVAS
jgi:hypothetical protein